MYNQETIQCGDQIFRRAYGPGFDIVRQMMHEIDPNLELAHPDYAPTGWAVLWNGPDAQWHAIMVNTAGDPRQLLLIPEVLRRRDAQSPVNSRESAFEKDMKEREMAEAARDAHAAEALSESMQRVYHGLRKDVGHHHGVTSKKYFRFGSDKTEQ